MLVSSLRTTGRHVGRQTKIFIKFLKRHNQANHNKKISIFILAFKYEHMM